jgi:beta-glucosidase
VRQKEATVTSISVDEPVASGGPELEAELRRRVEGLSLEQKVRLLTGESFWTLYAEPDAGLRALVVSDGPAGARGVLWDERSTSANVPSPTALAAGWDVDDVRRIGRVLAAECRRKGVDVLLAPTVNLHRTPFGGRHFECYSEDPLLTAEIGLAFVQGLQAEGVGATVKHFVANDSETERFTLDARVSERALRELYLAPFEVITGQGGAWSVMAAYNRVNGTTMTESPMLREILDREWGYDGVVMSDWFATRSTQASGAAALDLAMPGPHSPWRDGLADAVRQGSVTEAAVDEKVLRILRLAARVGALEGVVAAGPEAMLWTDEQIAGQLRATAAAGTVLLRNAPPLPRAFATHRPDGVPLLPLDPAGLRRIAVVGPNAARLRTLGGGSATVYPPYVVTVPQGLRAALGDAVDVRVAVGVRTHTRLPVADAASLRLPDGGGPGLQVRFLDAQGNEVGGEQRYAAAFNWTDSLAGLDPGGVAAVEVRTVLRSGAAGEYLVGASGIGRFALWLRDRQAFDEIIRLAPGLDPVEALSRPPQHAARVHLEADEDLPIVLRHTLREVRAGTSFEGLGVTFQLNVEEPYPGDDAAIREAAALASDADVAVVVVGTTEEVESEGYDRESLALPGRQDDLVHAVARANPRTVVVVNAGSPVVLPWAADVPALLMAWFPGQEVGNAIADVLLGSREPGGRLPVSWPAGEDGLPSTRPVDGVLEYTEDLFIGYRAYDRDGREPAFPFGHGLGWTDWDYEDLDVTGPDRAGDYEVQVRVVNSGRREGREVVQVYASRTGDGSRGGRAGRSDRPERWLAGFATVSAGPGEEVTAVVRVPARALREWDDDTHAWVTPSGPVTFSAGRSSRDLRVSADLP